MASPVCCSCFAPAGQHLLMNGAGRLFHRVIMQSNPFSYHYRSLTIANFLGQVSVLDAALTHVL